MIAIRLLTCRFLMLACCCLGPGIWTSTFGQDEEPVVKTDNKPARSAVRGRVLFADSEQPLRRATVTLRREFNTNSLERAITGKRGEFTFQGIAAGTYYIAIDAPGIVSPTNGTSFSDFGLGVEEQGLTLVTVDGTNDVKTEVRVTRGGAISGRVYYVDGEPATHAQMVLYRQKGPTAVMFFRNESLLTDDRGVYRIEGLPTGQYFVGAIENHSGGDNTLPRDGLGLVTAYHPDVTNLSAATLVSVQAGSETRNVNIKFDDEPRRISGTLKLKRSDAPVKHATLFLRRIGDPSPELDYQGFLKRTTPPRGVDKIDLMMRDLFYLTRLSTNAPYVEADDDGHWTFLDLPPGTYVISAKAPVPVDESEQSKSSPDDSRDDGPDFSKGLVRGSAEVTIKDKNVDDVSIELTEGGSIAGTVVIEGEASGPLAVRMSESFLGPESLLNLPAYVEKDLTFVLESVPAGNVRLDIFERGAAHYYIRSMTGKGLDLLTEPLKLNEGERVTGVQIVLGTDLATVEGRVVATPGGGSVAGGGVALLPIDQRKWNLRSTWGLARADSEGRFSLRLGPGEYFVLAWSTANEPSGPLESYFRTQLGAMRRVTLRSNETKTLEASASSVRLSNQD